MQVSFPSTASKIERANLKDRAEDLKHQVLPYNQDIQHLNDAFLPMLAKHPGANLGEIRAFALGQRSAYQDQTHRAGTRLAVTSAVGAALLVGSIFVPQIPGAGVGLLATAGVAAVSLTAGQYSTCAARRDQEDRFIGQLNSWAQYLVTPPKLRAKSVPAPSPSPSSAPTPASEPPKAA